MGMRPCADSGGSARNRGGSSTTTQSKPKMCTLGNEECFLPLTSLPHAGICNLCSTSFLLISYMHHSLSINERRNFLPSDVLYTGPTDLHTDDSHPILSNNNNPFTHGLVLRHPLTKCLPHVSASKRKLPVVHSLGTTQSCCSELSSH
jgi:hypothetical protein